MTAGQCVVADEAPLEHRGAAIGSFAAAGAAGETVGALLFGAIAHVVGLDAVFVVAGILLLLGVPIVSKLLRQRQRFTPALPAGCDLPLRRERPRPTEREAALIHATPVQHVGISSQGSRSIIGVLQRRLRCRSRLRN